MRVIIENNYQNMSKWAAEHVIERINAANPTPEKPFVLGLPTGSSPEGMYAELVKANKEGRVSFKNVLTFNMSMSICQRIIQRAITRLWPVISSTISTVRKRTSISSTAMPRTWLPSAPTTRR